jgi:hypothetical protein
MSETWKGVDLATLRGPTLAIAANDIMRVAADEAKNPKIPVGHLMARTVDDNGHKVTSWYGSPSVWMNRWAGPARFVTKVNLRPSQGFTAP